MAEEIGAGVEEISTCEANLLRIPEPGGTEPITMPGLRQIYHQFSHVPEATVQDLANCDGLAIGAPNYWGIMSYATKHFLDSAAKLWDLGSPGRPVQSAPNLAGKPATAFAGGGSGLASDPPILGLWTAFGCFGMTIVTIEIAVPEISDPARVDGGSSLGAQVFSRRPGPHPSDAELAIARAQGRALGEHARAWAERRRSRRSDLRSFRWCALGTYVASQYREDRHAIWHQYVSPRVDDFSGSLPDDCPFGGSVWL